MSSDRNLPGLLLISVLFIRPMVSGVAYQFAQSLLLIPVLLVFALLLLRDRELRLDRTEFIIQLPLLAILAWAALSIFWSSDPGEGVREFLTLMLNALAFLTVAVLVKGDVPEKVYSRHAAFLLCIIVCPTLLLALFQGFVGFDLLRQVLLEMSAAGEDITGLAGVIRSGRVFAGFLNPNMLAGFIAIVIPLTLAAAITAGKRPVRIVVCSLLLLEVWVLVMTRSIGGTGAAFAGVLLFLVFRGAKYRRGFIWAMAGSSLIFFVVIASRWQDIVSASESSIFQRFGYMASGMKMAMKHPFIGWGSGASPSGLMGFVDSGLRPVVDPHNFLVRTWISWGAIGVAILTTFLVLLFIRILPYVKNGLRTESIISPYNERNIYLCAFASSGAVFLLHSLVDMDFFVPEVSLFGWVCLGFAYGLACDPHSPADTAGNEREGEGIGQGIGQKIGQNIGISRLGLGAVSLLLILPSLYVTQAELTGYFGQKMAENRKFDQAADYYKRASMYMPFDGSFAMGEGNSLLRSGDTAEAKKRFEDAADLMETNPHPHWQLGYLSGTAGDWVSAVVYLQAALDRYPSSGRIRFDLSSAIIRAGDPKRGIEMLKTVPEYSHFDSRTRELAETLLNNIGKYRSGP